MIGLACFFFFRNVALVSDLEEKGGQEETALKPRGPERESAEICRKSIQILGAWGKFAVTLYALVMPGSDLKWIAKQRKVTLVCDLRACARGSRVFLWKPLDSGLCFHWALKQRIVRVRRNGRHFFHNPSKPIPLDPRAAVVVRRSPN